MVEGSTGPASRGIPSSDAYWIDSLKKRREEWKWHEARLEMKEILNIVFPSNYQETYYNVALGFINWLLEKKGVEGEEVGKWIKENNFSKATFYNRVLPKLKKCGMIRTERKEFEHKDSKKYRKMNYYLGRDFGNFLIKIGQQYHEIVGAAGKK